MQPTVDVSVAVAMEARRLAEKYGKDYFDAEDLTKIIGVGMNNARQLFCDIDFPTIQIGNRKVVSSIALALWSLKTMQ
ncbi:MAG: hypothetical protein FWB87_15550 [Defluviitaleaceae bacterium]|nr:hypothetical protein [Defluviitaleaceae bacterium]